MSRSKWKGPFLDYQLFKNIKNSKNNVKTTSRSSFILPCMLGKTVSVHNGKKFIKVNINSKMLGFRLGNFVVTRLRHVYRKKSSTIKNKKK